MGPRATAASQLNRQWAGPIGSKRLVNGKGLVWSSDFTAVDLCDDVARFQPETITKLLHTRRVSPALTNVEIDARQIIAAFNYGVASLSARSAENQSD